MQDENTTQSAATDANPDEAMTELNLGSNPAAQSSPAADSTGTDITSPDPAANDTAAPAGPADNTTSSAPAATPAGQSDELESIKSSALQELLPMVNELDQKPEEKYRTLMMLIQSSDNQSLIKDAFDAAHGIEDKKAKAEALLNIINEINYFTGKGAEKSED